MARICILKLMKTKEEIKLWFGVVIQKKQAEGLRIGKDLNQLLAFMESSIKRDLQAFNILSFTICGSGGRNFKVAPQFQSAYAACTPFEKVQYFEIAVEYLLEKQMTSIKLFEEAWDLQEITVKILKGIKIKDQTKIVLKDLSIDCKHFSIDLSLYLLRKSKKDSNVYIFETITYQEPSSIRLQLIESSSLKQQQLFKLKTIVFRKFVDSQNKKSEVPQEIRLLKPKAEQSQVGGKTQRRERDEGDKIEKPLENCSEHSEKMSLIEQLVGRDTDGNLNEEIYDYLERRVEESYGIDNQKLSLTKYHKNRLHIMLPAHYRLDDIDAYNDFAAEPSEGSKGISIYYSKRTNTFKMELILNCQKEKVLRHLSEAQNQKLWNKSINESQVKWSISSENAAIAYRKQKIDSQWFKERDFLFIRYLFKKNISDYIIDRSIQSPFFIPFESYQRGQIHHAICRLDPINPETTRLLYDFKVEYGGLLTANQKKSLALSYLRQYINLQHFIHNFKGTTNCTFDLNWEIDESQQSYMNSSYASIASEVFQEGVQQLGRDSEDEEASFYSIIDEVGSMETPAIKQLQSPKRKRSFNLEQEQIKFDGEGYCILPKDYLRAYHILQPVPTPQKRRVVDYEHMMMKKDFVSHKSGDMILANQAKIASQNNVIKYIMSTLKKNLFSGKGILNISLPVQIFNVDSNLQRLCEAMSLASDFLEKKAMKADTLQRFKQCIAFALSNSILYFDIDKPFNPILGETFQGIIDGCPVYAQQISHHPPISSILLVGRGYKVFGSLQAKVYVHLNSGEGVNEGLYTIEFEDGEKILFQTAPGEVSGLAVGDRKYRIKGKMLVIAPKSRLCGLISFQDESGLFSSNKWKFTDQMQGNIYRVSESFIRKFFTSERGKDVVVPGKKEIEETLGRISGRWTQKMLIDEVVYYDVNTVPHAMVHYRHSLNSNSDYREDLVYRKMNNMARSQQEKERLQIVQRNDRKLRQKYNKNKH